MSNVRRTTARLALAAAVVPAALLLPITAAVADSPTKAQVEHAEQLGAAAGGLTKAQVEHSERAALVLHHARSTQSAASSTTSSGPEAWQLAASAAAGALVTGVAMVTGRRLLDHPRAMAH